LFGDRPDDRQDEHEAEDAENRLHHASLPEGWWIVAAATLTSAPTGLSSVERQGRGVSGEQAKSEHDGADAGRAIDDEHRPVAERFLVATELEPLGEAARTAGQPARAQAAQGHGDQADTDRQEDETLEDAHGRQPAGPRLPSPRGDRQADDGNDDDAERGDDRADHDRADHPAEVARPRPRAGMVDRQG